MSEFAFYCVSLPDHLERRENARNELRKIGVCEFSWHDGIPAESSVVKEAILNGEVAGFPPCFRCGRTDCKCENNFLTLPQIAVNLVYQRLFERIETELREPDDWAFVCEDDVFFTSRAKEGLNYIRSHLCNHDITHAGVIRLGWALTNEHAKRDRFCFRQDVKMSNPCFLIRRSAAASLRERFSIYTTADIFIHRDSATDNSHLTLFPPIASEHSWSTGRFEGSIFARPTRNKYLRSHGPMTDRLKAWFLPNAKGRQKRVDHRGRLMILARSELATLDPKLGRSPIMLIDNSGISMSDDRPIKAVVDWGIFYGEIVASQKAVADGFPHQIASHSLKEMTQPKLPTRGFYMRERNLELYRFVRSMETSVS